MKFTLFSEGDATLADCPCDLLAIPVVKKKLNESEAFNTINGRLDDLLRKIVDEERFLGKPQQTLTLHTHGRIGPQRVLLVGLGDGESVAEVRHAAAKSAKVARQVGARSLTFVVPEASRDARGVQLTAEGVRLGRYKFD